MKPFSMMKTKSESNLAQRFDFVAVDIPLEPEPEPEPEKKDEDVKPLKEDQQDEQIKQDVPPASGQKGRRPSELEEGLKEFYDLKATAAKDESKAPEITLEDLDAISMQTAQ